VFLLTMMERTDMLRRFCVALVVGGKEKNWQTYEFIEQKKQQELCHLKKI
jgi:hypothetical protein